MSIIKFFHGSEHLIKNPKLSRGKRNNDYGQGFYCTESLDSAKEWAVKNNTDGYANEYVLNNDGLNVLNLLDGKHTVLNWIALLLENRTFILHDEIPIMARDYIIDNFSIPLTNYDIVKGYRADDSYFSYAQSFVSNTLPVSSLNHALRLGKLGEQIVLISEKAFVQLKYVKSEKVNKEEYYSKFIERDNMARESYMEDIKKKQPNLNDIFVMDILREGIKNDDPRIQRIIPR